MDKKIRNQIKEKLPEKNIAAEIKRLYNTLLIVMKDEELYDLKKDSRLLYSRNKFTQLVWKHGGYENGNGNVAVHIRHIEKANAFEIALADGSIFPYHAANIFYLSEDTLINRKISHKEKHSALQAMVNDYDIDYEDVQYYCGKNLKPISNKIITSQVLLEAYRALLAEEHQRRMPMANSNLVFQSMEYYFDHNVFPNLNHSDRVKKPTDSRYNFFVSSFIREKEDSFQEHMSYQKDECKEGIETSYNSVDNSKTENEIFDESIQKYNEIKSTLTELLKIYIPNKYLVKAGLIKSNRSLNKKDTINNHQEL